MITLRIPGQGFVLQDAAGGLRVHTGQTNEPTVGEPVEVIGFPAMDDFSPRLEDAAFRSGGAGAAPTPKKVLAEQILQQGTNDALLVDMEARLLQSAHRKGVKLAAFIESDVPTRLRGDPGRLRQVLMNLLGNAVKFTERGEVSIHVRKQLETDTEAIVRFDIQDTGIGIPSEAQRRLFQPFMQADGSMTRKFGGTGLGLAISKELVEAMNGAIGVESALGKGSTFWFSVRLGKQIGPLKACRPNAASVAELRVLIVDDNDTNRRILQRQVESWGMRPLAASGAAEALEILRRLAAQGDPCPIAILDMQMPEIDGLQLARTIKADPAVCAARLLMLTSVGYRDTEAIRACGIEVQLTKPVKRSKLFDSLIDLISPDVAKA